MKSKKIAVVPGSFDPPTNGHVDIINRASEIFDEVIVLISQNTLKKCLFTVNDRITMLKKIFENNKVISVDSYDGLVAKYAEQKGACALVRGVRNSADYSYETEIWHVNKTICPNLETLFLPATSRYTAISSSSIRELALYRQDISLFVPKIVQEKVKNLDFS